MDFHIVLEQPDSRNTFLINPKTYNRDFEEKISRTVKFKQTYHSNT